MVRPPSYPMSNGKKLRSVVRAGKDKQPNFLIVDKPSIAPIGQFRLFDDFNGITQILHPPFFPGHIEEIRNKVDLMNDCLRRHFFEPAIAIAGNVAASNTRKRPYGKGATQQILDTASLGHRTLLPNGNFTLVTLQGFPKRCTLRLGTTDKSAACHRRFDCGRPCLGFRFCVEGFYLGWKALASNASLPLQIATLTK